MSNNGAVSGHGVRYLVTLTPLVTSPLVFTEVNELVGDIVFKTSRANKKTTPHSRAGVPVTMDEYVVSTEIVRDEMTMQLNFDPTDATHLALRDLYWAKTKVALKKLGPGGVIDTSDDITQSGQFTSWQLTDPQFEGERSYQLMFRPSGPLRVDGVLKT